MFQLCLQIDSLCTLDADYRLVTLSATDGTTLPPADPGAHIDLHLPKARVRQYSLLGPLDDDRHYRICVKRMRSSRGGSAFLHDTAYVGMHLRASYPRNAFTLTADRPAVFVSAGIGITPFISMMGFMQKIGRPYSMHHYMHSAADQRVISTLCNGLDERRHSLYASEHQQGLRNGLNAAFLTSDRDTVLYLCGPPAFMRLFRQLADEAGWKAAQIRSESFAPFEAECEAESASRGRSFEIVLASNGATYVVPENTSIARVLLEHGVKVPLSCEQGMCGACLTRVIEGIPDHRDTVQTVAEKHGNKMMALCCSRANSDRIVLDL